MQIHECDQLSDSWWTLRRGVPTASEFSSILTPKTMKLSAGAMTYTCKLIGDTFDPRYPRKDGPATAAMRDGTEMEPFSRRWYEFERNVTVRQVGFVTTDDGRFGCSPDGLVGSEGGIQLKNPQPHVQVRYLLEGGLPDEHKCQVHGELAVSGREWWDFVSHCEGLPPLIVRGAARRLHRQAARGDGGVLGAVPAREGGHRRDARPESGGGRVNVLALADLALSEIAKRRKGHVYASRPGIAGGCLVPNYGAVMFRRVGGRVVLEIWRSRPKGAMKKEEAEPLPPDLERRAAEMLDTL